MSFSLSLPGSNSIGEELSQTHGVLHAADITHRVEYTDWKCCFISFTVCISWCHAAVCVIRTLFRSVSENHFHLGWKHMIYNERFYFLLGPYENILCKPLILLTAAVTCLLSNINTLSCWEKDWKIIDINSTSEINILSDWIRLR